MQFRSVAGGECQAIYPAQRPPAPPEFPAAYPNSWLRVERRGDRFSAFASTDGKAWKLYAAQTLALAGTVHVGPALTSHDPQVTAKASFRNYTDQRAPARNRSRAALSNSSRWAAKAPGLGSNRIWGWNPLSSSGVASGR